MALAGPIADFVVAMAPHGRIATQGSLARVLEDNYRLSKQMTEESKEIEEVEKEIDAVDLGAADHKSNGGKLILDEEIAEGHVGWSACESRHVRSKTLDLQSRSEAVLRRIGWRVSILVLGGVCGSNLCE